MRQGKQTVNYERLDRVVAGFARRDDRLSALIDSAVLIDDRRFFRATKLAVFLGYESYRRFERCIHNAQITASNSKVSIGENFVDALLFDGEGPDIFLSEWAVYATLMEADSKLKPVALAKSYFAGLANEDAKLEEARLKERQAAKRLHKRLHGTAEQAGIKTAQDHAVFDDHGYRGMYGMSMSDVERRKGVPPTLRLIDCADSTELAANNLRMSLTTDRIVESSIREKSQANTAHFNVGRIVRRAVTDASGRPPEALPLAKDDINCLTKRKAEELRQFE